MGKFTDVLRENGMIDEPGEKKPHRYSIKECESGQAAVFHFTAEVPVIHHLEVTQSEFKKAILAVDGVVEMSSGKQAVHVTRGGAYSWNEIEVKVVRAVAKATGINKFEKVKAYR